MRRPASAPTSRPRCAQSAIVITAPSKRPAFPSRPSLLDAEAEALLDAKLISSATPKPVTPKAQRRVSWNFVSPEDAMACLRTQPLTTALDSNATSPVGRPSKAWPIMDVEESDTGNSGAGRQAEEEEEEEAEAEEVEERPLRPRGARAFWPAPADAVAPQQTPTSLAAARELLAVGTSDQEDSYATIAEAREAGRSARAAAAEAAAARATAWEVEARAAAAVLTAANGTAAAARVTVDADAPDATPAPAPAPAHAPVPAPPTSPPTTPGVRSLGSAPDPCTPPAAPKREEAAFERLPREREPSEADAPPKSGGGAADGGGAVLVAVQALQAQLAEAQATMRAQSNQISELSSYMVPPATPLQPPTVARPVGLSKA